MDGEVWGEKYPASIPIRFEESAARDLVNHLSKQGARVAAWTCDVGDEKQLLDVLARCKSESWPTIRGVIQGAMVLNDAVCLDNL